MQCRNLPNMCRHYGRYRLSVPDSIWKSAYSSICKNGLELGVSSRWVHAATARYSHDIANRCIPINQARLGNKESRKKRIRTIACQARGKCRAIVPRDCYPNKRWSQGRAYLAEEGWKKQRAFRSVSIIRFCMKNSFWSGIGAWIFNDNCKLWYEYDWADAKPYFLPYGCSCRYIVVCLSRL